MKTWQAMTAGFVLGAAAAAGGLWTAMPSMMVHETRSPRGLEETVAAITNRATAAGWVVQGVSHMEDSIRKHGGGAIPRVWLVNLCQAQHAQKILVEDSARRVSVMMPCTIAVYEKADGVYLSTLNAGLMGRMFGGVVAEVMGGAVARDQAGFVDFTKSERSEGIGL